MELTEYNERQRSLSAAIARLILRFLWPFRHPNLSEAAWNVFLRSSYPEVERYRRQAAELGREFYDSEREKRTGSTEKHDFILPNYEFDWYKTAMEPAKSRILQPNSTDEDLANAVQRAVKEVENGGRRAILRPVQEEEFEDPEVIGWARVATGRETCGFCMMMVSRGPVYFSAEDAGLDLDDSSALELIEDGDEEALAEAMKRWHPGCDCKAVPVFDRSSWAGRDAYLRAERLWIEATRGYRGKDALNAFRRAVENGDVSPVDFAAAA